jgi:phospholipid transport system substrate-binding protein
MYMMKKMVSAMAIALLLAPCAFGSQPLDAVKGPVNNVIDILRDPACHKEETRDAMREKIRSEIQAVFDYTEMSKRTLARYWKKFSADEQQQFTRIFGRLLEDTYIDKVVAGFEDEEIVYLEERITDNKAMVKTKIVRNNTEIPVDYSLINTADGLWRIYDVRIEGVSLVKNYRSQFSKILRKTSPSELIDRIGEKIEKLKKSREALSDSSFKRMIRQRTAIVFLETPSPMQQIRL